MSDIVERLRSFSYLSWFAHARNKYEITLIHANMIVATGIEAAAEIDRLTRELSEARATGRREGMAWSARYHDDLAAEHEACGWESQHHEMMVREHRRFAAAIRASMEKDE